LFINDIFQGCPNISYLLYADDLKIFQPVKSPSDCAILQDKLEHMSLWCKANHLKLNISKCQIISFYKTTNPIFHQYSLQNTPLTRVSEASDLGVIFDSSMSFSPHINYIIKKSLKNLGFIIRNTKFFSNIHALKVIYCSLVRSNLDYNSPIWSPHYSCYSNRIESVQNKFLRYIRFKIKTPSSSYSDIRALLSLPTLDSRRNTFDILFIYKVLNNHFDVTDLISLLNFRIPTHHTRLKHTFVSCSTSTSYIFHSPAHRLPRLVNELLGEAIDIFNSSQPKIKKHCLKY